MRGKVVASVIAMSLGAVGAGCSRDPTQLLVVVDSDLTVPAQLAGVDVQVRFGGVPAGDRTVNLDSGGSLPFSFGVAPRGDLAAEVTIALDAFGPGGGVLFRRTLVTGFLEGKTLRLPVHLTGACQALAPSCGPASTCTERGCDDPYEDPTTLSEVEPGTELETAVPGPHPRDASPPAPRDAELDTADGGGPDARRDAGPDAGPDAGGEDATEPTADAEAGVDVAPIADAEPRLDAGRDAAIDSGAAATDAGGMDAATSRLPEITSFEINPLAFNGASVAVTVVWATRNASQVSLEANGSAVPGFQNAPAGTFMVTVTGTRRLELIATGPNGTARATRLVAQQIAEAEPNATIGSATDLGMGASGSGTLDASDTDVLKLTIVERGAIWVHFDVCPGLIGLPLVTGRLLSSAGVEIASLSPETCDIDPGNDEAVRDLGAGTYYLELINSFFLPSTYSFLVVQGGLGCGNGFVEPPEVCDDHDRVSGDGCSASCTLEPAGTVTGQARITVPLEAKTIRNVLVPNVAAGSSIRAVLSDGAGGCPSPATLYLSNMSFVDLGSSGTGGPAGCAAIIPATNRFAADLPAASYQLLIVNRTMVQGTVTLDVENAPAACGNRILEGRAGEICDDGNRTDGDRCSSACQFTGTLTPETEPNNALNQANNSRAQRGSIVAVSGRIDPAGDLDHFYLDVPAGQRATLIARTYGALGDPASCPGDTRLSLFDPNGRAISVVDDIPGVGTCSLIDGTATASNAASMAGGRYVLRVQHDSASSTIRGYSLDIELR